MWVQDEWSASERAVREEAQQAGVESPTVFVFLPRIEADELRQTIARLRAAEETVKTRAVPQTSAGTEARASVESRVALEQQQVSGLADNIVKNARVYQGGGYEVVGESFHEIVRQAVEAALVRLFPKFTDADQPGWNRVVSKGSTGRCRPTIGPRLHVQPGDPPGLPGRTELHRRRWQERSRRTQTLLGVALRLAARHG